MNIDIQDIQYELCDDGGLNSIWLPIILPVKTQFHHEFGTYTVEEHFKRDDGKILIICERVSKKTHPHLQ